MTYWEVMRLPIRAFWTLNRNINRLLAEEDLRALMLHTARQSPEGAQGHETKLRAELYQTEEKRFDPLNEQRDDAGFAELKAMVARPTK
jgi:hypothetical protein